MATITYDNRNVLTLLAALRDPEMMFVNNGTPESRLIEASITSNTEVAQSLIKHPDVNMQELRALPLLHAMVEGHTDMVKLLLPFVTTVDINAIQALTNPMDYDEEVMLTVMREYLNRSTSE